MPFTPPSTRPITLALRKGLLYYDRGIILVNKPRGTVCQLSHDKSPAEYKKFRILLEGIRDKLKMDGYPFPVHRLDQDTTGALLLARSRDWARKIQQQFLEGTIHKTYLALVHGGQERFPQHHGVIEASLSQNDGRVFLDPEGKKCITKWEVLGSSPRVPITLLRLQLLTGHKHQLRIHLAKCLRAPVLGDPLFAKHEGTKKITDTINYPAEHMFLHSSELSLTRFNKSGPSKRFTQSFRVPAPSKFQVFCRDAKIPFDTDILNGNMFLNGEPWRIPHHLLQEDDTCWVSDHLLPKQGIL